MAVGLYLNAYLNTYLNGVSKLWNYWKNTQHLEEQGV